MFLKAFRWDTNIEKFKVKKAISENYSTIVPFSVNWNKIEKISGEDRALECLKQTATAHEYIQKIEFEVKRLDLVFQGFLKRRPAGFPFPIPGTVTRRGRNMEFSKFLATNDTLTKAYVAYLAVQDISFFSYFNREKTEDWIEKLWSEKELAFLEERPVQKNSLFSGERLKEFFPKYATLNYFFTGMFMENLLWKKIEPDKFLYPSRITLNY